MKKTFASRTYSDAEATWLKWRMHPVTRPMTMRRQLSGTTVGSLLFRWNAVKKTTVFFYCVVIFNGKCIKVSKMCYTNNVFIKKFLLANILKHNNGRY